jgi:hypothetical protein
MNHIHFAPFDNLDDSKKGEDLEKIVMTGGSIMIIQTEQDKSLSS